MNPTEKQTLLRREIDVLENTLNYMEAILAHPDLDGKLILKGQINYLYGYINGHRQYLTYELTATIEEGGEQK